MKLTEEQLELYEKLTPLQKGCVDERIANPTLSNSECYRRAKSDVIKCNTSNVYIARYGFSIFNHRNVKAFLTSIEQPTVDDAIMQREEYLGRLTNFADTTVDDVLSFVYEDDKMMNVNSGELQSGIKLITVKKMSDIPEHARRSIKKIKQTRYGIEVELVDPLQAMKLLADAQGFNAPVKTEISGPGGAPIELKDMSDDQFNEELLKLGYSNGI